MGQINDLAEEAFKNAVIKGFYENKQNFPTRVALMHGELSEALEADRTDNRSCESPLDTLSETEDNLFIGRYNTNIKGSVEEELADVVIRVMDTSASMDIDLENHILAKMRYNSLRPHMHGGKKY